MNDGLFQSIDERCRSRFESDWIKGSATDIADYLPDRSDELYEGTLNELIHIDMEFRWKQYAAGEGRQKPDSLEKYIARFPELNQPEFLAELIRAEFELRWQHNDQPEVGEYETRFGRKDDTSVDVPALLGPLQSKLSSRNRLVRVREGMQLGRYKLVAEHGRGGFSAVWRADDEKMGRRIALKRLSSNLARQSETRRRFVSEARITARLEHPGIVPVYDMSNVDDDHAYYTMKLVRGDTLAEKIDHTHSIQRKDSQRAVEENQLLRAFLDVCNTIEYCHSRGVVHRDIKPQNVVVGSFGETIVLDWGLASFSADLDKADPEDSLTGDQMILSPEEAVETIRGSITGTPAYMPPEQAGAIYDSVGLHSDVYSLGAMLYHIIVGRTAFEGGRVMDELLEDVRHGSFPKPRAVDSSVPAPLESICLKAMQLRAADRYQSVHDLSTDVERYLADEPVSVHPYSPTVRLRRWVKKNRALATGAALAVLFGIGATVAGTIISRNAEIRELQRVADIRSAAEQAEASGMVAMNQSDWETSMQFFEQCVEMVQEEPALADIEERVLPKAEKMRTIVEAYDYAEKAQYYLFNDHLSKAAIYSQATVRRLDLLENPDWWNEIAIDGMRPEQVDYLQEEVFRLLGMWAAMRFAETTPHDFNFDWFVRLLTSNEVDPEAEPFCNSARFASACARRYRPSVLMDLIDMGAGTVLKEEIDYAEYFPVDEWHNPSDAAMLGSILDTFSSEASPIVMTMLMGNERDPETAAEQMLLEGLSNISDWYWLTIFVGQNQVGDDKNVEAIRAYSHGLGIKPDGWMAYSQRATAYLNEAYVFQNMQELIREQRKSEEDRDEERIAQLKSMIGDRPVLTTGQAEYARLQALKSASQDIKRAEALAPHDPAFLYNKVWVINATGILENVCDTMVDHLFSIPFVGDTTSGHRRAVVEMYIHDQYLPYAGRALDIFETRRMAAVALLWAGDYEAAAGKIKHALEMNPDDNLALTLQAFIRMKLDAGEESIEQLAGLLNDESPWFVRHQLGIALEQTGQYERSLEILTDALPTALVEWQLGETNMALAEIALQLDRPADALDYFNHAVKADLSVRIDKLQATLTEKPDEQLDIAMQAHLDLIQPYYRDLDQLGPIRSPAFINGTFELELSDGWGDSNQQEPRFWEIVDNFWTEGTRDSGFAYDGEHSFRIDSTREHSSGEGMSRMVQEFPVSEGVTYKVTCWCRAESTTDKTLGIYLDEEATEVIVPVAGGSYGWQQFTGEFTAQSDSAKIVIACKDIGTAWIDAVAISAID